MSKPLHVRFFSLLFFIFITLLSQEVFSQGCNGANGTGIFTGSIANRDNGTICANNATLPGIMEIDIGNIDESGVIQFEINWDDGSAPERIAATKIGANRYFASATHFFPPNGGQVKCEYRPDVRLVFNGALCAASLGTPPRFVRWNTDDQQTGDLNLTETITNVNEYLVCAGAETNVTFTDRSDLNCVPPDLVLGPNDKMRWRQFVYGTASTITGAVRIGGAAQAFPFNGIVDASTEPTTTSGFPTPTTQIITIPATAQVGEFFEITMNYWNTCNPYPARPAVIERAYIRIVDQPPAPTGNPATEIVCNGNTPTNPTIAGVPAGNVVNWYRNDPGDVPGTLITSGAALSLPITSVPGYTNNTTAGVYKVWASYRPNVANALNCESPKILITRTIREVPSVPNPTVAPPTEICNNNSFSITMPAAATETIGGPTQYTFSGSAGISVGPTTATTATFNVNATFAPGELFADHTIVVSRRYTNAPPACNRSRTFTIRVYNETVGGTPSDFPDVCEGTSIGPITLSGHIGTIVRWEVEKDGGGFGLYTGPASGNSITPGLLSDGTYRFKAIVDNGPCNTVESAIETVVVTDNPTPPTAGTDQAFCGSLVSAPLNATLPAGVGTWSYVSSIPAGRPAPTFTANDMNTTVSIANASRAGEYTLRWTVVSGSCTFTDDVIIDFGAAPDPVPPMSINVCGETATLNAPTPTIGSGVWMLIGGPGGIDIDDSNSPTANLSLQGPGFGYGTYTWRWTVTSGICPTESGDATVRFSQPVTATASDINGVCLNATGTTPIALSGNIAGGATGGVSGTWVNVDGNGTIPAGSISVGGGVVNGTYEANAADYTAGTPIKVKLVSIPLGGSACPQVEQEITINVDRVPVPDAGVDKDVCENFVQLDAETPIPFGATGQWTGPAGITFDNPTDPQTIARNLPAAPSSRTLRWTLTSAGGNSCTAFDEVVINRITPPNASNLNLVLCEVPPAGAPLTTEVRLSDHENSVTSLAAADRTIQWYQNGPPPLGTLIADPTILQTNVPDGKIYVARIRQTSTSCTSDAIVTINVRQLPTANNATVALCEEFPGTNTATNINLLTDNRYRDAVTTAGNLVTWYSSLADAVANVPGTEITTPFDVVGSRDVFARVTYTNAPACTNIAQLTLQVNQLPDNAIILGRSEVCLGDPSIPPDQLPVETYQVFAVSGAKYYWDIPTGPNKFKVFGGGGEDDFFVLLQFPNIPVPNPETIKVRVELNGCSTPELTLDVRVNQQPADPVVLGTKVVCENEDGVRFEVDPTNFPLSNYSWQVRRQSDNSEGGGFILSGQGTDEVFVRFTDEDVYISVRENNSICISDTTQHWVNVNRRPVMMNTDATVCSDLPTNIIFQAHGSSPVAIDKYDITNVVTTAGITYINPATGPAFPVTDVAADAIEDHVFENLNAVPLSVDYTVVPISVGAGALECEGTPQVITVTVNPEPQLSPGLNKEVCSGAEIAVTLISAANTFPADRFIIDDIIIPAGVTPVVPGDIPVADGTTLYEDDVIFNNRWENTTGANQTVQYSILPYSTLLGCAGNPPTTVNITIYPRTDVDDVTVPPLCNGDLLNVIFTSANNTDADFLWIVKSYSPFVVIASPAAGQGNITNMILTNTSQTLDGTVTFEVRGKNPPTEEGTQECANPTKTFVVTIRKSPRAIDMNLIPACSDTPGGNTYTADLAALETSVSPDAGNGDTEIRWFTEDPSSPTAVEITGAALDGYLMTDAIPVFVQVRTISTTCTKVVRVSYQVNPRVILDVVETNLFCKDDRTGQITATILAGTPPYTYSLDGGPFFNAGPSYTFDFLSAGTHQLEVQDSKGCGATEDVILTEPDELIATLEIIDSIQCFLDKNAIIQTNVEGGTSPYTSFVLLQTGASNTTGRFENLGIGSYNVRVTDSNGCTVDSDQLTLTQPDQVEVTAAAVENADGFHLSCRDMEDGQINVTAGGGVTDTDYTYTLVRSGDPTNPFRQIADGTASESFTALPFGTFTVRATDDNGCTSLPAIAVIVNPPPFNGGFVGLNQSICLGDNPIEIEELVPAFGGVGNYTYRWQQSVTGSNNDLEWFDILGASGTQFDPPAITSTTYYRRIVTSGACAEEGKNNKVKVTVNPLPIATFEAPGDMCEGGSFLIQLNLVQGTAPFEYDYSAGTTTSNNNIGGTDKVVIPVSDFTETTTYTLTRVKDLNGCLAAALPPPRTVTVLKYNSSFDIVAPDAQCSGLPFTFEWVVEDNVRYTWIWPDGTTTPVNPGDRAPGLNTIPHLFPPGSPFTATPYAVRLSAVPATGSSACLPKDSTKFVTVHPTIALNILPEDTVLCGGELLRIRDQSLGVDQGTWYYRELGTTDRLEEKAGPAGLVTYTMNNTTTQNPIIYEVIYEAENDEGCTADYKKQVVVYRGINADFDPGTVPPYNAGVSEVTFTNTSVPIDAADFEYEWNFGDPLSVPATSNGIGPFEVVYNTPGVKNILLRATNIEARNAGEICQSDTTIQIDIIRPDLAAAFTATPLAACFPVDIVVDNNSPGADNFVWELYNEGGLVTTSTLSDPVFRVLKPGKYDIYLTAKVGTTQSAFAELKGIEVYDVPSAIFEVRPNPVYVPDTEMRTFNFSTRANQYEWDFDDGFTSQEFEPKYTYRLEGKYMVTLVAGFNHGSKDVNGDGILDGDIVCADTAQIEVVALDGGFLKLPNAFTPNPNGSTDGNGTPGSGSFNDVFLPITKGVEEFTMQIFDRWGTLIFETRDKNVGWDGYDRNDRLMPAGVYVYKLVMRLSDGQRTTKVGDVTLIR